MPQEDKLKREIDLIGKLLAKLLSDLTGAKNTAETDEVIQSIRQSFQDQLDLDLNTLIHSSQEEFKRIIEAKKLNGQQVQHMADLFYQLAEQSEPGESRTLYEKTLVLYEQGSGVDNTYSLDRHYKIQKIRKLL